MKSEQFQQLITRVEGETLDFKEQGYDLSSSRAAFIKDVLAMANTPREGSAYIVFGVRWKPEEGSTVVGLSRQLDDAALQAAMGNDKVHPVPRFQYTPLEYEGKQVGVLEIPVGRDGPYSLLKSCEGLPAGVNYYRKGSTNELAVGVEVRRIYDWFTGGEIGPIEQESSGEWNRLLALLDPLKSGMTYILATDKVPSSSSRSLGALGRVPWRAAIDFDPDSETDGLLSCIAGTVEQHRVIHKVVKGEYRVQPEPGTHWFFARGLSGRQETLCLGPHSAWLKSYKHELAEQLKRIAGEVSPSPVLVLVLWSDVSLSRHLRTLVEELLGAFGESIQVVVVSDDAPSFAGLAEDDGASFIRMSLRRLASGLAVHFTDQVNVATNRCVLSTAHGTPVEVERADWLWLSEDLELVHRSTGIEGEDEATEFRCGAEVTWRNLHLRHDCDRDIVPKVRVQVEADLRRRQTVRINLYHEPGGGGTTAGRRVAWEFRTMYPVAILRKCSPRDTAGRINKVAAITESSVLLVVDGGDHSEREIADLYEFLKASQTPVVVLQILRRFRTQDTGMRQFWLAGQLTESEADRFLEAYGRAAPKKRHQLSVLAKTGNPQRNAFFFGLTAFESRFRGLETHVKRRIDGLTSTQRRILVYIALAHYYGQQAVPANAFATLLGLPQSRQLRLDAAFAGESMKALELLVETTTSEWRIAHQLIAHQLMVQVMAPEGREREEVWRQNLSLWGKDFVTFCRGDSPLAGLRLLELVRRVLVYRDNVEMLGTERAAQRQFAQFIEDIPSQHGRIDVLRHLVDCFPLEAHFHAHLGRFLGLRGEYAEALVHIDFAISLQPSDHVLHHMRGMAFRQELRSLAEKGASLDSMIAAAKSASSSFEEARRLEPELEHGYISEVQMLVDLIDRASQHIQGPGPKGLADGSADPYLRQALEKAEDLLDRVRHLHAGEPPSRYAIECRARLQSIYGDFQTALQAWDQLLARQGVAKAPIRRQLVWTILRRRSESWDRLTRLEAERIRRLLEENLDEGTSDSTSLRLWLRAIRHSKTPPSIEAVLERVSYWKVNTGSLDASYYLYVLHTLHALDGSIQGAGDAERALEECRALSRFRRDRTRSFEWIGMGSGVASLVHQSRLGDWKDDFWETVGSLRRLSGRVSTIEGPEKGWIALEHGVKAFFVPGKVDFHRGRDENVAVTCFVGFSYDGVRAWEVRPRVS